MRVQELVSCLQECRRKEAQWMKEVEEKKEEGKSDVIGAIMAAIGEMPDTLGGGQPGTQAFDLDVETLGGGQSEREAFDQLVESDVERVDGQATIEIMDEDVVCIEETFDSNLTVEKSDMFSEKNKQNEDDLMEEVTIDEELSFTAAMEELGGLLDFSPL